MNKSALVAIIGLLLAVSGGVLRFNAKAFSMHVTGSSPLTGPIGGTMTFSQEDTAKSAALSDFGMVLLYTGSAFIVLAATAWLFAQSRSSEHETRGA